MDSQAGDPGSGLEAASLDSQDSEAWEGREQEIRITQEEGRGIQRVLGIQHVLAEVPA